MMFEARKLYAYYRSLGSKLELETLESSAWMHRSQNDVRIETRKWGSGHFAYNGPAANIALA